MGRFLADLGHPDQILCAVELIKAGGFEIELIPQHEDKVAFGVIVGWIFFVHRGFNRLANVEQARLACHVGHRQSDK